MATYKDLFHIGSQANTGDNAELDLTNLSLLGWILIHIKSPYIQCETKLHIL